MTVVTATRLSKRSFEKESWLSRSLHGLFPIAVTCENKRGLPEIYNEALDEARDEILLLAHDDIWIVSPERLEEHVHQALDRFDVVGLAGNTRRVPGQFCWISADGKTNDNEYLSGAVAHPIEKTFGIQIYGPSPREVKLLDGLFFAVRSRVLREANVRFDMRFLWHFYDLDVARSCERAGLKMGTWPILVAHASSGAYGSDAWKAGREAYFEKWGS